MKKIMSLSACMLLLACHAPPPPSVDLSTAILTIQKEIVKSKTFPIANYVTWTNDQKQSFKEMVHVEQCKQGTADPILPIITGPLSLALTGSFTSSGSFQISNVATAPSLSLSGSSSRYVGQNVGGHVSFVSLSSVPSTEQEQEAERAGGLLSQSDRNRDFVAHRIISERDQYYTYVTSLIQDFTPLTCASTDHPKENYFVGVKYSDIKNIKK